MNFNVALLRGGVSALLIVAGLSLANPAWAQTDQQKEQAREHFLKARRLYDVGRYVEAIEEYEQAYLNVPDPVFLYNMAQAYRLNDQPDEALRLYRNYLRNAPEADNRADVEQRIADMQRLISQRAAESEPSSPPLPPPVAGDTSAGGGVDAPRVGPGAPVLDATAPPPAADGRSGKRTAGFVLVAGGGGLIAVAAVMGVMANNKATQLEEAAHANQAFDPSIEKSGKLFNGIAVISGVAGVVASGVGLYLLLTDRPREEAFAAAPPLRKKPDHQLVVLPTVGPDFAGAGASFRF